MNDYDSSKEDDEFEHMFMHVVTKGGESYCRDLGLHKGFSSWLYLTAANENGRMIQVDDDRWLSLDSVASIRFTRMEVH